MCGWRPILSVGLGICIAATIHTAAAIPNLYMLEYQPPVFEIANLLLKSPLTCEAGYYEIPTGAGLGVELDERTSCARFRRSGCDLIRV